MFTNIVSGGSSVIVELRLSVFRTPSLDPVMEITLIFESDRSLEPAGYDARKTRPLIMS
jgi:hypothetical protein